MGDGIAHGIDTGMTLLGTSHKKSPPLQLPQLSTSSPPLTSTSSNRSSPPDTFRKTHFTKPLPMPAPLSLPPPSPSASSAPCVNPTSLCPV
ncbi:unnamed protein product [Closterium sp. NIES-54]